MKNWKSVMDKMVSVADLSQFFSGTVVLYKEKPAKILSISAGRVFKILILETQSTVVDENALGHIMPPNRRLGMVNYGGGVFYMKRFPMRMFQIGINNHNTSITSVIKDRDDYGQRQTALKEFDCRELADAMFNRYPTIKECIQHNKEFGGGMAFDKQFAIDELKNIWYKTTKVGKMPGTCSTAAKIEFKPGYEHLAFLLDGNYEKDLRNSAPSCCAG